MEPGGLPTSQGEFSRDDPPKSTPAWHSSCFLNRMFDIMIRPILFSGLVFGWATASWAQVEFWATSELFKIRPEGWLRVPALIWDAQTATVRIAGARNEYVPFQVIVSVPPPASRREPAAEGFFVEVSDLTSPAGRISRDRLHIYLQHVVLCYGKSSPVGDTGLWPDALVPLAAPFSMAGPFRRTLIRRALWVDVYVPPETAPGDYQGTIRLLRNGVVQKQLNISLHVWDYVLPAETHMITYMGVSGRRLAAFHNMNPDSPEARDLLTRYHAFLRENRMEPWFNERLQPKIEITGDGVRLEFDHAAYQRYLGEWKFKRAVLEAGPAPLRRMPDAPPFSELFNRRVKSYLSQVAAYFRTHGWLDRLVFNSPIDEPNSAEDYEQTRRWAQLVHEAAPGVPFLATEAPVPDDPSWGTLTGYVNHFAVHGNALNRLEVLEAIQRERQKGGEVTWYISCDQVYPQPNYFIDAPAMDPVMVPWITWRHRLDGILYWALDYWTQTVDPWLNPVTYLSGFFCSGGGVLNGEGSLLYPGSRARRHTGQPDVDGPVPSLRFLLLREGIEDYERLWLLKSLGAGELADRIASDLVADVSAFSRNPEALYAARRRIAERLEQLWKTPR